MFDIFNLVLLEGRLLDFGKGSWCSKPILREILTRGILGVQPSYRMLVYSKALRSGARGGEGFRC
jgi:hypothetical protein